MQTAFLKNPETVRDLLSLIAPVLVGSPFERKARWGTAVVVLRNTERRITSRGDFAMWLSANDLRAQANECIKRKVPRGSILVWVDIECIEVADAGFIVFDVGEALRLDRGVA